MPVAFKPGTCDRPLTFFVQKASDSRSTGHILEIADLRALPVVEGALSHFVSNRLLVSVGACVAARKRRDSTCLPLLKEMCGIRGIYGGDDKNLILNMMAALKHRGLMIVVIMLIQPSR